MTGIDGSGKSTAARGLVDAIIQRGGHAVLLRNPSGRRTMTGWWSRLGHSPGPRLQDSLETVVRVWNVLLNQLRAARVDGVVVMDRGLECQLAVREAAGVPQGRLLPWLQRTLPAADVVVHFDLPVDVALERVRRRATDSETRSGLADLQSAYRRLSTYPAFHILRADRPPEDVLADLITLAGRNSAADYRRLVHH